MQVIKNSQLGALPVVENELQLKKRPNLKARFINLIRKIQTSSSNNGERTFESTELYKYNNQVKTRKAEIQTSVRMFQYMK